jgi:hypothetical protein
MKNAGIREREFRKIPDRTRHYWDLSRNGAETEKSMPGLPASLWALTRIENLTN